MARTISIGAQSFVALREGGYFYVDKTAFVRDWWRSGDQATLICRPRRFGKTLNLSMVEAFFSTDYAGRGDELFGGLAVWGDPAMRALQGTVPVVALSFARAKQRDRALALAGMKRVLAEACRAHGYLLDSASTGGEAASLFAEVGVGMDDEVAASCLNRLCSLLAAYYGTAPIVLLDEYDTPMQEAWLGGYWDDMALFQRALFNATFKTNPALGRALITGVTRVARESIFSDLNNLKVVTTLSDKYDAAFGLTEREVLSALEEYEHADRLEEVRAWYDGFSFGGARHVYNPWSLTNYLDEWRLRSYWANTSSNALVSTLVRTGGNRLKDDFATLLDGGVLRREVDDEVVFSRLASGERAVWSLLLAAGYLRADNVAYVDGRAWCDLAITNHEVLVTFEDMVGDWFGAEEESYNEFVRALLAGDVEAMGTYLGDVARGCMSSFDSGTGPDARSQPERFWHGLVLGLLVELRGRYAVESNRESGYGRHDVMLVPHDVDGTDPAVVLEFKVFDGRQERTLADTVARARRQIDDRGYAAALAEHGMAPERVRAYGIAFRGKEVLVG